MKRRIIDALWKIILGAIIGLGLVLAPLAVCQGQGQRRERWPPPPVWGGGPLPAGGFELEVVTATVGVDAGAVLTYADPYTNVVEISAGTVTDTGVVTLTSLVVPRHPPTSPWIAWVGQAFELDASCTISAPITATVHHYDDPGRWFLVRWEAIEARWYRTPSTLWRADDVLVARIYQPGEFAVVSAPYSHWLPVVARGGGR
jgi:hypothetical protein